MQVEDRIYGGDHKAHPAVPVDLKPGHVFVTVDEEIDNIRKEARRFRQDEEGLGTEFTPLRLRQGVYGQRQVDQQMIRVKLPFGGISADQMDVMAEIAAKYSGMRRGHITTRENIQFHFVSLEQAPDVLRLLQDVGITTREACGHSVRNVTGCPYAGVCPDEVFDATPYAAAFARVVLRSPISQNMPRKWKTAFSSCPGDCAGTPINDLGFVPKIQQSADGREIRGFEIRCGGGTSTMVRAADTIYDFVPVENGEYIRVAEAMLRVFDKEGGLRQLLRKNLNKARVKFLVKKLGVEEFKRQVEEELDAPGARDPLDMDSLTQLAAEGPTVGEPPKNGHAPPPEFARWQRTNVVAQRQPGYVAVTVTVLLGNLSPEQFRGLGDLMRRYAGGNARTQLNQNLVLRWVREDALVPLHAQLTELGLGEPDAGLIADTVACPGTDSCKLGITSSPGIGRVLRESVLEWGIDDPLVQEISIKASGCPNGCGQHHLAAIGLQGASVKVGLAEIPCFDIFLGGDIFGTRVGRVPAKRIPQAVRKIIQTYQDDRQEGEPFIVFVDRVGAKSLDPLLDEFRDVGPVHEDIEMYMDWGKEEMFEVVRGEGECSV